MAVNTEYLHLIKPSHEDFYNIEDFNNNFDIIDTNIQHIKNNENEITKKVNNNKSEINRLDEVSKHGRGSWTPKLYAGDYLIPLPYVLCGYLRHGKIIILNIFFEANLSSISDSNKNNKIYLTGLPYSAVNNNGNSTSQVSAVQAIYTENAIVNQNRQIICNTFGSTWYLYYRDDSGYYRYLTKSSFSTTSSSTKFSAVITYSTN